MKETTGCWFVVDCHAPEEERKITSLCDACRSANFPSAGSYWDFKNGCGPWDIVCSECKTVLHKHIDEEGEFLKAVSEKIDAVLAEGGVNVG